MNRSLLSAPWPTIVLLVPKFLLIVNIQLLYKFIYKIILHMYVYKIYIYFYICINILENGSSYVLLHHFMGENGNKFK